MAFTHGESLYESIAIDLNTQRDFCYPDGACPVTNARLIYPSWQRFFGWLRQHGIPIISAIDSRRAHEIHEIGRTRYCVDGSEGQLKVDFTLMPLRLMIEIDNTLSLPPDLLHHYQQLIFRKRTDDLLCNPKADHFLTQLNMDKVYIFGNTVERSVKVLALGLLARHKHVSIITDACGYWSQVAAHWALRQVVAKGGELTTIDELTSITPTQKYRRNGTPALSNGQNKRNGTNAHVAVKGKPICTGHDASIKSNPLIARHPPQLPREVNDSRPEPTQR